MDSNKRPRLDASSAAASQTGNLHSAPKSRLLRACAECKKHKIKCDVRPGQTSCNKCLRSGIPCVPYNLAQKFIDEDAIWKTYATSTLDQLKSAVQYLLDHNRLPGLAKFIDGEHLSPRTTSTAVLPTDGMPASPPGLLDQSPSVATEQESDLVPVPMSNLYSLTETRTSPPSNKSPLASSNVDFIGRGVLPILEAEYLYAHYRKNINTLLWAGVLCQHATLQEARQSSSLLVAAILTVAALHTPGRQDSLRIAYGEFVSLSGSASLLRNQSLDDIRGLCIGAFYITNLSWSLCSQAVRMATEMNLHRASSLLLRGYTDVQTHERLRLWYVLYICDHQFATAYGRPPLMHDDAAIKGTDKFLTSQHTTPGDIRLTGQVRIQQLLGEAYYSYGCDPDSSLDDDGYDQLRAFNLSVDQWRLVWVSKSVDMPTYGSYPSRSKVLYYHFVRFHLNSLSLRGISARKPSAQASPADLSWDRREAANAAISAATSTLKLVIEEKDLSRALVGVPIFTHSMIAMCASFLIKLAVVFGSLTTIQPLENPKILIPHDLSSYGLIYHTADALDLVKQLVGVLNTVAEKVSQRHLACHLVKGLRELMQRFIPDHNQDGFVYLRPSRNQDVFVANTDLLSTRSVSRTGDALNLLSQNSDLRDAEFDSGNGGDFSTRLDGFDFNHDDNFIMSNFDWIFDDSSPWQTNGQGTFLY